MFIIIKNICILKVLFVISIRFTCAKESIENDSVKIFTKKHTKTQSDNDIDVVM